MHKAAFGPPFLFGQDGCNGQNLAGDFVPLPLPLADSIHLSAEDLDYWRWLAARRFGRDGISEQRTNKFLFPGLAIFWGIT